MRWTVVFAAIALIAAAGFATAVTAVSYALKGFPPIGDQTWDALKTIWGFWAGIGYGIGMIAALTGALRSVLARCIGGYRIVVVNCQGERLESLGAKPYFKIWRRWFFGVIWINAAQVIILIAGHKLIFGGTLWMGWYTPWWLTPMIIVSALFALPVLLYRCKNTRIEPCAS
jgi:hypothetical protein